MDSQRKTNLLELLDYINPADLNYSDWISVGMALQAEGYDCSAWDDWSRRDAARYHAGECVSKWRTFRGDPNPVAGGTIVQMAKENGWTPTANAHEIGWDDIIGGDDLRVIDSISIQEEAVVPPDNWNPAAQLITYLETLFEAAETVGYVVTSYPKDDRFLPTKGNFDRTAGELISQLSKCNGDIGSVLGDYKPEAGAWIRFNPLDGKGVKNENVTDYRYALVESDDMEIEKQNALIRGLELPVACLVHSGGKSLHAIVKVDAGSYDEYRKRVDYLYSVLKKNGMTVDTQNRNPSRLSRMPGVIRNGKKQFLVDTNIGKESWQEWKEWIEGINDDLPDFEDEFSELPPLAPELISGILRQGHKMLVAGPSKAGKSFALIELAICIAEGIPWMGFKCAKGKVLYVNLELDRASCLHRFHDVRTAMGITGHNAVTMWNLRGKSIPMDKLAPKLIRRAQKQNYIAIIIDPIYKIITGDENSADQMSQFCNQFDKVCTDLGCAVIYCHHHSKGAQGGKRSIDRASGSGVFARDPDAVLDLIQLDISDGLEKEIENNASAKAMLDYADDFMPGWTDRLSDDDKLSAAVIRDALKKDTGLQKDLLDAALNEAAEAVAKEKSVTAWRIEGTLREFPAIKPINVWFRYPVHEVDCSGVLSDIQPEVAQPTWRVRQKNLKSSSRSQGQKKVSLSAFDFGFDAVKEKADEENGGVVQLKDLASNLHCTVQSIKNWVTTDSDYSEYSLYSVGKTPCIKRKS